MIKRIPTVMTRILNILLFRGDLSEIFFLVTVLTSVMTVLKIGKCNEQLLRFKILENHAKEERELFLQLTRKNEI
jgi:hypothetical protein